MLNNKLKGDNMNAIDKFVQHYYSNVQNPILVNEANSFVNNPNSLSHMAILRDSEGADIALVTAKHGLSIDKIWKQ